MIIHVRVCTYHAIRLSMRLLRAGSCTTSFCTTYKHIIKINVKIRK